MCIHSSLKEGENEGGILGGGTELLEWMLYQYKNNTFEAGGIYRSNLFCHICMYMHTIHSYACTSENVTEELSVLSC